MNSRTKRFWLPAAVSLAGSMGLLMILQKILTPLQMPWKHAGVPVLPYLLWLITLPLTGAAAGYLSSRFNGNRAWSIAAVLFPSILMTPIWLLILLFGAHHLVQWENFLFGVSLWIIVPGAALLVGAWRFVAGCPTSRGLRDVG